MIFVVKTSSREALSGIYEERRKAKKETRTKYPLLPIFQPFLIGRASSNNRAICPIIVKIRKNGYLVRVPKFLFTK
jgi:uncharacterized membrane protein